METGAVLSLWCPCVGTSPLLLCELQWAWSCHCSRVQTSPEEWCFSYETFPEQQVGWLWHFNTSGPAPGFVTVWPCLELTPRGFHEDGEDGWWKGWMSFPWTFTFWIAKTCDRTKGMRFSSRAECISLDVYTWATFPISCSYPVLRRSQRAAGQLQRWLNMGISRPLRHLQLSWQASHCPFRRVRLYQFRVRFRLHLCDLGHVFKFYAIKWN